MLEKNEESNTSAETGPPSQKADEPAAGYKAEVIRLINLERQKSGAADLKTLDTLGAMADTRAKEASVLFRHTRPDGTRCFTIFAENALKYRAAGENLAYGFKTPEALVKAWMSSEGHRRNNLDPDFKFGGVGYHMSGKGTLYCSILFFTPK
ncbi:MAG: hypothetical protein GX847_02970 [Clostridiales bacterium]|nr:hypothetical protein [Clostridiales bacterium]